MVTAVVKIVAFAVGALAANALLSRKSWADELQTYFGAFHDQIKLDEVDEKRNLAEKREVLLQELRTNLPGGTPPFTSFNQGSYSMHTGVFPLDGNYDIDVGIVFECAKDKYPDPVILKCLVRNALQSGNRTVDMRRPCVTVTYLRKNEPEYHVDLVVYVKRKDGKLDLAMGKEHSASKKRHWEVSEPRLLTELVNTRFDNLDYQAQYRRCIRYLKRWRDMQFPRGGPVSIGLTLCAYHWFEPSHSLWAENPRDITALREWVEAILKRFENAGEANRRLRVTLPVAPKTDVLSDMTTLQMAAFERKLMELAEDLRAAEFAESPEDACDILSAQFGNEFSA